MQHHIAQPPEMESGTVKARRSVSVIFFINGFVFASWVPHIPAVKAQHGLSDAALGGALLAIAVGAVLALPAAGHLVGRFGSRRMTSLTASAFCLALPLPVLSVNLTGLLMALVVFGAFNAMLDVSMNAQAVEIERRYSRSIMSSFHGLFSLGGLLGAAVTGLCLAVGMSRTLHVVVIAACALSIVLAMLPGLLTTAGSGNSRSPVFVRPSGILLGLGMLAFLALMVEGAMADWTAVYLRETVGTSAGFAAAGYAAFSLTMAGGRFAGDRLVDRIGARRMLAWSGWLAAAGLGCAVIVRDPWLAVLGFALVGAGASNVIPMLFSAAGRVPGLQPGMGLAAVATTGYLGFLTGPPLIGLVAQASSMATAIGLLALLCCGIALRSTLLPVQADR